MYEFGGIFLLKVESVQILLLDLSTFPSRIIYAYLILQQNFKPFRDFSVRRNLSL